MQKKDRLASENRYAMRYIYPAFVLIGIVLVFPLLFSLVASFMKLNLVPKNIKWVGIKNYSKIFSDSSTWHSIWLTLRYAVISVAVEMILGFIIASFAGVAVPYLQRLFVKELGYTIVGYVSKLRMVAIFIELILCIYDYVKQEIINRGDSK